MKNRKLQKYLYEHPELLDDAFSMSLTEADRWASENPRSAAEVLALAREKHPEIPAEKWAVFDKAAQKKTPKKARGFTMPTFRIRWWQVAIAFAVLIVLTFTLVPHARACAESMIRYIVSFFEGGIDIRQEGEVIVHGTVSPEDHYSPSEEDDEETDCLETTFPNLSAFTEYTGYRPVRIASDAFSIREIWYQSVPNVFDKRCTTYESKSGVPIYVWEVWGNDRGTSIFENEDDVLVQTTVLDGKQVIGYADTVNDEYVLEVLLDDSNITIMYQGHQDYQEILEALRTP